jgi:hypothetical protein
MSRLVSNVLRLASITGVDYANGVMYTEWIEDAGVEGPIVPIPHPYPGKKGEGVFVGFRAGNVVALGMLQNEEYVPVSSIPLPASYTNSLSVAEVDYDDISFPYLEAGDVVIQGASAAQLRFDSSGNVVLETATGEGITYSGNLNDSVRCSVEISSPVAYNISEVGMEASGIVRRDVRTKEGEEEFVDLLTDPDSEQVLEEVGWDATKRISLFSRTPVSQGTVSTENKTFRNPARVEKREVIFEYARGWNVGNFQNELIKMESSDTILPDFSDRRERRSNVLSLSQTNPNELIEKISGNLVDIFGNVLNINKSVIPKPTGKTPDALLQSVFEMNRRAVAYHMEINTKKGYGYRETEKSPKPALIADGIPNPMSSANNARDRSRWAFRVDKEGLTTFSIPATSETGTVPFLTRQETSSVLKVDTNGKLTDGQRDDPDGLYRNSNNQDIFHDQFGPGGVEVKSNDNKIENRLKGKKTSWVESDASAASLPKYVEAGTAFHDITQTAKTLLEKNINRRASEIATKGPASEKDPVAVSQEINAIYNATAAAIRDPSTGLVSNQPNAGGRSAQVNLDGSLEMSIGANTVDRVSWALDTAGALVARLGRDRQGRSAIIHSDGTIAIEVGGFDFVGEGASDQVDTRFVGRGSARSQSLPKDQKRFRDGKVVIRVRRANTAQTGPDVDENLLVIDESGMTLITAGQFNIISKQNMTFQSESSIILEAPVIQNYKRNPKYVLRDGRIM